MRGKGRQRWGCLGHHRLAAVDQLSPRCDPLVDAAGDWTRGARDRPQCAQMRVLRPRRAGGRPGATGQPLYLFAAGTALPLTARKRWRPYAWWSAVGSMVKLSRCDAARTVPNRRPCDFGLIRASVRTDSGARVRRDARMLGKARERSIILRPVGSIVAKIGAGSLDGSLHIEYYAS